ncbi:MAG: hypothetical protein WBW61_06450 [Rhodanobacteraceae bacterium]
MPDTMDDPLEHTLRNWLLHRLADAESSALEQRLLLDRDFPARVEEAEYDLIDDYARDRLDADERLAVETHLLGSAAGGQRAGVSRALAQIREPPPITQADSAPPPARKLYRRYLARDVRRAAPHRRSIWRRWRKGLAIGALTAAVLIAVVLTGRVERGILRAPVATSPPVRPAGIANLTLLASTERGVGEARELTLPRDAEAVRVQVEVEHPDANIRYGLVVADGARNLFSARDLALHRAGPYAFVEAVVPAALLAPGRRHVTLLRQHPPRKLSSWDVALTRAD